VRSGTLLGAAIAAILALVALPIGSAGAQEPVPSPDGEVEQAARLPLAYAQRPLTLPRFVLNPLAEVYAAKAQAAFLNATLAAAFGVTDDFELEAVVAPLQLSPKSATFGQADQPGPSLGVTYRPVHVGAEVGLHFDATVITLPAASGAVLRPGIPVRFHAGKNVRIDLGAYFLVTASQTTTVGFALPVAFAVDLAEPFHLGINSGLSITTFDNPFSLALPFGFFAGYAIGTKEGPILDIDPFFRWPNVASTDVQGQSTLDQFEAGVELGGFFYL
jgi:hypothetical protein